LASAITKTNQELNEIIKRKNIINFIRAQRLSWLGHIERMQGTRMVKAIYSWKRISRRPIGRPKTPSTKTELARSHRKDARYENGKGTILLETHLKKANRKTKDTLGG